MKISVTQKSVFFRACKTYFYVACYAGVSKNLTPRERNWEGVGKKLTLARLFARLLDLRQLEEGKKTAATQTHFHAELLRDLGKCPIGQLAALELALFRPL